jgi:hypothetical protein
LAATLVEFTHVPPFWHITTLLLHLSGCAELLFEINKAKNSESV